MGELALPMDVPSESLIRNGNVSTSAWQGTTDSGFCMVLRGQRMIGSPKRRRPRR